MNLFRKNQFVVGVEEIEEKLFEGESRLELALHYKIPYPRPSNVSPGATGKSKETPRPAYMSSYDELNDKIASSKKMPQYGNDAHLGDILRKPNARSHA
mmetsp:Transcript_35942/g.143667  ORF Transcript_35942/g.143667 Transcript_35942/m.143667 type:complete len:99 (+) Transcript_35942:260-556(+)